MGTNTIWMDAIEESIENLNKLSVEVAELTQTVKEWAAEYDSVKSHFHPIAWFFIKIFYKE